MKMSNNSAADDGKLSSIFRLLNFFIWAKSGPGGMNHAPPKLLGGQGTVSNRPLCELWLRKSYSNWKPQVK